MIRLTTFLVTTILLISLMTCTSKTQETATDPKTTPVESPQKLKALIIDGENNHGVFPLTTMVAGAIENLPTFLGCKE